MVRDWSWRKVGHQVYLDEIRLRKEYVIGVYDDLSKSSALVLDSKYSMGNSDLFINLYRPDTIDLIEMEAEHLNKMVIYDQEDLGLWDEEVSELTLFKVSVNVKLELLCSEKHVEQLFNSCWIDEADLIHQCLVRLEHADISWWITNRDEGGFDNSKLRELLKITHALAKHGARWDPADNHTINSARRSLLKMDPDYTVEFVWIMSKYQACSLESLKQLLKTPAIRRHVERQLERIDELISDISN